MSLCMFICMFVCMTAASVEEPSHDACEKSGSFLCRPDRQCLSNSSLCNGVVDCSDASDELDCHGLNAHTYAKSCYYALLCWAVIHCPTQQGIIT